MRIQESTVQLSASHQASRSATQEITTQSGFRQIFAELADSPEASGGVARQNLQEFLQSFVDAIIAALDGKKCEVNFAAGDALPVAKAAPGSAGEFVWQRQISESVSESEKTEVCGSGCVKTSDGRAIDFDFSLNLARDYVSRKTSQESLSIALRDPLILSFDGKSSELTGQLQNFDLDADGVVEQIPGLGAGSGFLVFDRNGNGRADNGSELFGAASGDGFADLTKLDSDHNGWIDEADPAFSQLAVWSADDYRTLAERGVGALYVHAVEAPFALKNSDNELLGQIREAGIYLAESGAVGHLQQVDLAVSNPVGSQQPGEGQQLPA
ncbi:MAG: hypothetical protein H6R15_4130 [Proteobacteria bacterium]|nr:hypothetical protein [Pseudomonadota bacterium]